MSNLISDIWNDCPLCRKVLSLNKYNHFICPNMDRYENWSFHHYGVKTENNKIKEELYNFYVAGKFINISRSFNGTFIYLKNKVININNNACILDKIKKLMVLI